MIDVPSDEIILSSFKRIIMWTLSCSNKTNILDQTLSNGILKDFIRSRFENNYFFYRDNLIVKISQNVIIFLKIIEFNLYLRRNK